VLDRKYTVDIGTDPQGLDYMMWASYKVITAQCVEIVEFLLSNDGG
jgi:hypothetical protein